MNGYSVRALSPFELTEMQLPDDVIPYLQPSMRMRGTFALSSLSHAVKLEVASGKSVLSPGVGDRKYSVS
jgi:hypothetical protein